MQLPWSFQCALSFVHTGAFECEDPFECKGRGNYASLLPILGIIYKLQI